MGERREEGRGRGSRLLHRHAGLIGYTALNYLDKLLIFLTPLAVLSLYHDRSLYNEVEYIYSIAAVVAVPMEFGLANYFLFAYRESGDRGGLVERARYAFLLSFAIYVVVVAIGAVGGAATHVEATGLTVLVATRALFVYFLQFYGVYFRLVDRPAAIFGFSCAANLATLAVILVMRQSAAPLPLGLFFAAQAVLPLAVAGYGLATLTRCRLADVGAYAAGGLKYAWPISLNVLLFMVVNNYGKVYARNWLSEGDMFQISFVQRLALIIQLAHSSAVGYLVKAVFVDDSAGSERRLLAIYTVMIGVATVGVMAAVGILNTYSASVRVSLDAVSLAVIAYTILWCYSAYFELYLNRINRNKSILLISVASAGLFGVVLSLDFARPLTRIGLAMVGSALLKLILTIEVLRRSRKIHVAIDHGLDYRVRTVE